MIAAGAISKQRETIGKTHRSCPICQSEHLEYEFVVEKSPVCSCLDCGLLFINPQPEPQGGGGQVPDDPAASSREIYSANATSRIEDLVAYGGRAAGGRLLIAGGDPHLSAEAQRYGFEVINYDATQLEDAACAGMPGSLDACILYCTLERMRDPLLVLRAVRAALTEHGTLMVVSPVTDSPTAKLFRENWWAFSRANLFYFSTDTLQNLLLKAGFGDPIITPDRIVVSLNYLRRQLNLHSRRGRYRMLRTLTSMSPVLRNKSFRLLSSQTRFLVRPTGVRPTPLLSVIVPVFNEGATFVELFEQLLAKTIDGVDIEIIVVESNSTDGSRELVLQYRDHPRVRVILEDKPRGKGHAVRTALAEAKGDVVLFQDADLEYDINDYDALLGPILRFEQNFVLGSRHTGGKSWKIRRFSDSPGLAGFFNFGHLIFLTLFNVLYRQRLSDPFTMFKVFRRDCLWGLSFECNRFDFDHEIVIKLLRKGYKPLELPVNYTSRSLNEGKKVTMFRDPLTWIRALLKFRNSPLYPKNFVNRGH